MFAKSKQIGLVSLFVMLGATIGGCAESVGNEPASFPSQERPVAFITRNVPTPMMLEDERASGRAEMLAAAPTPVDVRHFSRPVAIPR